MAKLDEVKEFIGFLKVIFVTLIAIDTSLIAWIFKNHSIAITERIATYSVFSIIIIITILICLVFIYILKNIKKLKDL